ncbi:hypothetical protein [Neisseria sp. CCUG12390]|uniref:hypothetical protein n=1 Tax=Neisseria sp. CCUG12390 TaxID=3392035 RepID=UPI003A102FFC
MNFLFFDGIVRKSINSLRDIFMFNMFNGGIHKEVTVSMFANLPRRDQDSILQDLYDKGYNGKELAKFFGLQESSVYNRINAHRGRGGAQPA